MLREGDVVKVYIWNEQRTAPAKFVTLRSLASFLLNLVRITDLPGDRTLKQLSIGLKPVCRQAGDTSWAGLPCVRSFCSRPQTPSLFILVQRSLPPLTPYKLLGLARLVVVLLLFRPPPRFLVHITLFLQALCAEDTAPVLKALRMMRQHSSNEVAVIDGENKMRGSFSTLDVGALAKAGDFSQVGLPIQAFFEGGFGVSRPDPLSRCCRVTDTLETLLERFLEGGTHKVYVVNDDDVPLGELHLRDVVRPLLDAPLWLRESESSAGGD